MRIVTFMLLPAVVACCDKTSLSKPQSDLSGSTPISVVFSFIKVVAYEITQFWESNLFKNLYKTIIIAAILSLHICAFAQWTKTSGPPGMNVNYLYQSGNILFAGTASKGVFRSFDNGVTWQAANTGISNNTVFTLISDASFLYAGTNNGVFRSSDSGNTWHPANTGIKNLFVRSFYIANNFLFAGTTGSGLFKSSTQGNSWGDANGNALNSSIIYAITYSAPHLVVVADNSVFYSNDNGGSWFIDGSSPFILTGIPSFVTSGDSVMVSTGTGVFRSFDGGVHWGSFITIDLNASLCGLVRVNNTVFAGGNIGMYSSKNFGKTWTHIQPTGLRQGSPALHNFAKAGNNFLLAYDEIGVAYSSNTGSNWNYTLKGFAPIATIDNALFTSGNIVLSGTHGDGVYQSTHEGGSWIKIGTGNNADTLSNSNIFSVLKVNNIILAGTCSNGLYRSADNGVTWMHIRNGLPQQSSGFLCVHSLARTNKNILIGTDQGLFYSSDSGRSWHSTSITNEVVAIAANGAVACAASESTEGFNNIFRSTNNGVTWSVAFQTAQADWASAASDGSNHFYIGTLSSTNLLSNDNGVSWQNFGTGIPANGGGFTIAVLNSNVFVGNGSGVYFSNNFGASFTPMSQGFNPSPNNSVQGLAISSTNIYAGLFQNSVWKRPLTDFGINAVSEVNNLHVTLTPNPVINESKITYSVAAKSRVLINIYNANGNLIKNLVNKTQDVKDYTIYINKNTLHEGNYFINVIVGDQHSSVAITVK